MVDKWWISGGFFHMKNKRKLCNKIIFFLAVCDDGVRDIRIE